MCSNVLFAKLSWSKELNKIKQKYSKVWREIISHLSTANVKEISVSKLKVEIFVSLRKCYISVKFGEHFIVQIQCLAFKSCSALASHHSTTVFNEHMGEI